VIPIGAGNEVTVVFQDGFQLKTIEELEDEKNRRQRNDPDDAQPMMQANPTGNMNGFNTDQMLQKLGKLDPRQFPSAATSEGMNNG
jgi:conjugal transfer pilus assembly protein TraB